MLNWNGLPRCLCNPNHVLTNLYIIFQVPVQEEEIDKSLWGELESESEEEDESEEETDEEGEMDASGLITPGDAYVFMCIIFYIYRYIYIYIYI